mgnify:CR=1 FL=1
MIQVNTIFALGINHKTAPVALREKLAFAPEQVPDALHQLATQLEINDAVILSTCNRTELYFSGAAEQAEQVLHWLAGFHQLKLQELQQHLYLYQEQEAVKHLMRVAAGLDSLVLGEPQILGQVKQAYNQSRQAGTINPQFERLFQKTFAVAKEVRTETDIGANAVSVAFAAVTLAKQIFGKLEQVRVLLIGAGETIELVARHLTEQGATQLSVANRTYERAETLAKQFNKKVDVVFGCGGDRDKAKRPVMGKIASDMSDKVIFTSDNPRSENPDVIIDEMRKGVSPVNFKKTIAVPDRKEALRLACSMAEPGDIILVAGKGHEKYQEVSGIKTPFDDKQVLLDSFKLMES